MKFIIVGLGSIGSKHKKNLIGLGHQVVDCHRDDDLNKLIEDHKPNGVLVCTPTALHLRPARIALENNCDVFLEKPISDSLKGVNELIKLAKTKDKVLMVGYQLRFINSLIELKANLDKGEIGKIYSARVVVSSYFPNWRPGVDYKKNYGAKLDLGGGVILDLSHELDYVVWLLGAVKTVNCLMKKVPELEIETEALAEILLEHASGAISSVHLDYIGKEYMRNCQVIGEKGSLSWDYKELKDRGWNNNVMYVDEIKHFINVINKKEELMIKPKEAKHVLEIAEAAKMSSKKGQVIRL